MQKEKALLWARNVVQFHRWGKHKLQTIFLNDFHSVNLQDYDIERSPQGILSCYSISSKYKLSAYSAAWRTTIQGELEEAR